MPETMTAVRIGWYENRSGHPRIVTEVNHDIGVVRYATEDGNVVTDSTDYADEAIARGWWVRREVY